MPLYKKWQYFFWLFDICIDKKTVAWNHLPIDASVINQPALTMEIISCIRENWIEKLKYEQDQAQNNLRR